MPGDDVTGLDVARIGRRALHGCLYDIGRFDFEVGFNHWPDRVVEQSEFALFPAIKYVFQCQGECPPELCVLNTKKLESGVHAEWTTLRPWSPLGDPKLRDATSLPDVSRISTRDSLSGGGNFPTSTMHARN